MLDVGYICRAQNQDLLARHAGGQTVGIVDSATPLTAQVDVRAQFPVLNFADRLSLQEGEQRIQFAALDLEAASITRLGGKHRIVIGTRQFNFRPLSQAAVSAPSVPSS